MNTVRIGIIGMGGMGGSHATRMKEGRVANSTLTAVCDIDPARREWVRQNLAPTVAWFDSAAALMDSGAVDAVIITTPHYQHPTLSRKALEKGLHVMCEKPAGVFTKNVRELNAFAARQDKVFGIMFNQRTNPAYQKIREMVRSGELGSIKRIVWLVTNWYRPQSYYDNGGWRATWSGEGGAVLLNQDPHQLDLWQWMFGMPKRVRAFMAFGKYHNIEGEDDVTAYLEYEGGATGLFVTGTGETPGTNRLEISCDMGKIVVEDKKILFWKNEMSEREFNATWKKGFGSPKHILEEVACEGIETGHVGVLNNWVDAIRTGAPLLVPGIEGINGLTLSNSFHLSQWTDNWVDLPINEDLFVELLNQRIKESTFVKNTAGRVMDVTGTFG